MGKKLRARAGNFLFKVIVLALLLYAGYALYQEFTIHRKELPEQTLPGLRMVAISDGDTGDLSDGQTVRFLGIDTPELGDSFCREASDMTSKLCLNKNVRLEYDAKPRDEYGRVLAYLFVDDSIMVNEVLVRAGLASVYIFPSDQRRIDYRRRLILAQIQARKESRGIWSLPAPEPVESNYLGNPHTLRFHRPGCRSLRRTDKKSLIEYPTRDDFLDAGFSRCRICQP
jgi:micrococcal nuclease